MKRLQLFGCSSSVNSVQQHEQGVAKILKTLPRRYSTLFLLYFVTTCGVILIREAQYIDFVVLNDSMKGGKKDGKK